MGRKSADAGRKVTVVKAKKVLRRSDRQANHIHPQLTMLPKCLAPTDCRDCPSVTVGHDVVFLVSLSLCPCLPGQLAVHGPPSKHWLLHSCLIHTRNALDEASAVSGTLHGHMPALHAVMKKKNLVQILQPTAANEFQPLEELFA